jgi:hypothetical protein
MLTTKDKVKIHIGVSGSTDDTVITQILQGVDKQIKTYCGWNIEQQTISGKLFDGYDQYPYMSLGGYPIESFSTPQYNAGTTKTPSWTDVDRDDYEIYLDTGIIYWNKIFEGRQNIKLSYKVGYSTVPYDIELVAIRLCARVYEKRKSEAAGNESVEGVNIGWANTMTEEDKAILETYRIKTIV